MGFRLLFALAALAVTGSHAQNQTTWVSTTAITEKYDTRSTVEYGSVAVTPVRRSTSFTLVTSYTTDPTPTSKDKTVTRWITEQLTIPTLTYTPTFYITLPTPLKVTSNGTSTITSWVSPTIATITLSNTACANNATKTATEYTGTYSPFPEQVTTSPTLWPTAVTTYASLTASSRVYTQIGSTVTLTSTVTGSNWLSTITVPETKTVTVAPFRYNSTVYLNTVTVTSSDWQLDYTTKPATACSASPTVTRAAQCAPTNLISERDDHGTEVQLLPLDWRFPLGFPNTLIGIPGMDPSACCQLCLDNPGCALSEWTIEWSGACRLFYYGHGNDTCGADVGLEYYASVYEFPRQASYIQAGCGRLDYHGVKDPFCPTCEVPQ